jgi:plastocyanin
VGKTQVDPRRWKIDSWVFAMLSRKFLIVAVMLSIAVTLYLRAAVAPADGAQPPNLGTVTVTDSAITPSAVTILAGGSVLWTNRGSRPHKIVSSRGAFKAFELAPAHLHRVPFLRPGVYPYTVDAVTKGVVVVITGSAYVPPAAASSTGPENCGHPKIYHYDIELVVHRDETGTITPPSENAGPGVNKVFDWHAKWSHAPMSVELCRGKVRILLPPGTSTSYGANEGLAADESTFKIAWDDKSKLDVGTSAAPMLVPLCHFTEVSGSPAKLALDGDQFEFTFHAYRVNTQAYPILGRGGYVDKNCDHRRATSGPGIPDVQVGSTHPPFHTIDGFDWSLSDEALNLHVSSSRAPTPFPLNALVRGKGFDFRTGPLQTEIRTPGISDAVSDWATVSFTPARP